MKTAFLFWTRWSYHADSVLTLAHEVCKGCLNFARAATAGENPPYLALVKTPGRGAQARADRTKEEAAWRAGFESAMSIAEIPSTFHYLPVGDLPVCSAWSAAIQIAASWEEHADALAFPPMDLIDALLPHDRQAVPWRDALPAAKTAVEGYPKSFARLIHRLSDEVGFAVGGFKTLERSSGGEWRPALKDRIEEFARSYAAGTLADIVPGLADLLLRAPDLRVRSEAFALTKQCYHSMKIGRDLDPWVGTLQMIVGAFLAGFRVEQENLGYLLEEGWKDPAVFVEQTDRIRFVINRLRDRVQRTQVLQLR